MKLYVQHPSILFIDLPCLKRCETFDEAKINKRGLIIYNYYLDKES
jgi:hypothetical protein